MSNPTPTGSPPISSSMPAPINGSSDFSAAVLAALGLPVTQTNVAALNAWQAAEGQWGARGSWNAANNHNPLNLEGTTHGYPDTAASVQYATPTNPINVYASWSDGVAATAQRISANPGIVAALKGNGGTAALSAAVSASGWGTGSFAGNTGANQGGQPSSVTQTAILTGKYTGGIPNPLDPGQIIGAAGGAAGAVGSTVLGGLGVLSDVTSAHWWHRVGMGVAGVALIIGGVALFLASTKPGQEAITEAPAAAAAAAVAA